MCNHAYTGDYRKMPRGMGERCPYPDLYRKSALAAPEESAPKLPTDGEGRCLFHSQDAAWKRQNDFAGQFRQLVQMLNAEQAAKYYDFAEFVFVGSEASSGSASPSLHISHTMFLRQAFFTSATFFDSLILERVEFRDGADFRRASFVGDLKVAEARFAGIELGGAEFRRLVLFSKVEAVSFALFTDARFTGNELGYVVKFEDSRFEGITDFSGVAFLLGDESSVGFQRTRFEDSANFSRAQFRCQVDFSEVSFGGVTEFIDTAFDTVGSTARYRGSAVEFNQIEVQAGAVLRFESTDPQNKLFKHDVQMSFKEEPAGLIRFENVNFQNIGAASRERLTKLARLGKVEIGSGCIKYRFQTPVTKIDVSEGNAPLILKLCQTFSNYFTASNGLNLGLEVVERTSSRVHFFFFTDENISEEEFLARLDATAGHMWSLLSARNRDQLLALEAPAALARPASEESVVINAVDCVTAMIALFFGVGIRIACGRWHEADTRALRRAVLFRDEDPEIALGLHVVLVDRYTGANLLNLSNQQHAGLPPLILAYRDEPALEVVDVAILTAIEVERVAVCRAFGLTEEHRVRKGSRVYWRGRLALRDGEAYELVVAQAPDAANIDAAILTTDLLHHWKPGAALLVGIAATTDPTNVRLGDIVVGSDVYYYERGKVVSAGTRPEPKLISADATLWASVTAMPAWDSKVPVARPDGTDTRPWVHLGVIASGEKVIANAEVRDEIAAGHRKIIAIEMEGYGFSRAVWQSFEQVRHLDIRAICDDGSKDKSDGWHAYAAAAAASFAKHLLLDRPLAPRVPSGQGTPNFAHSGRRPES